MKLILCPLILFLCSRHLLAQQPADADFDFCYESKEINCPRWVGKTECGDFRCEETEGWKVDETKPWILIPDYKFDCPKEAHEPVKKDEFYYEEAGLENPGLGYSLDDLEDPKAIFCWKARMCGGDCIRQNHYRLVQNKPNPDYNGERRPNPDVLGKSKIYTYKCAKGTGADGDQEWEHRWVSKTSVPLKPDAEKRNCIRANRPGNAAGDPVVPETNDPEQ